MKPERRQSGLSLIEQTLVVAIVGVLLFLGLPAAKHLFNTIETPAGVKSLIGSALSSAKAMAARDQQYVGIRFQHAWYMDDPDKSPLKSPQYMIFIIYDKDKTGLVNGFRAIEGVEPLKLPENIGVMDLTINQTQTINSNTEINTDQTLWDTTTFSIVFAPSGKLVVVDVQTRNRDNEYNLSVRSEDDIFNTQPQVEDGVALFIQDENTYKARFGLDEEPSRRSFVIYDRNEFRQVPENQRWDMYLKDLEVVYINPYTGTFINR